MSRKIDLEKRVMKTVVGFEKKRSFSWLALFLLISLVLSLTFTVALVVVVRLVAERRSLELFSLLGEDPEVIAEFWKDSLFVFLEELPVVEILLFLLGLLAFVIFILATGKRRKVVVNRLRHILK